MAPDSALGDLLRLLEECLAADSSAERWGTFAQRIHGLIAGAVVRAMRQYGRAPSREQVDDLVQDTYVKLCADNLSALRRFRGGHPAALVAYLRIVAHNATRDRLRASASEKRGAGRIDATGDEVLAQVADPRGDADPADRRVLLGQIERLLNDSGVAGDRDRRIFWLYYRHGLTARAIAALPSVGLTAKGVESTIFRLTRLVREMVSAPIRREGNDAKTAST